MKTPSENLQLLPFPLPAGLTQFPRGTSAAAEKAPHSRSLATRLSPTSLACLRPRPAPRPQNVRIEFCFEQWVELLARALPSNMGPLLAAAPPPKQAAPKAAPKPAAGASVIGASVRTGRPARPWHCAWPCSVLRRGSVQVPASRFPVRSSLPCRPSFPARPLPRSPLSRPPW